MPLINTPVIVTPCQTIFFSFKKNDSHPFSWWENLPEEKKKKRREACYCLPPPPACGLESSPLNNTMAWKKKKEEKKSRRGWKCEKDRVFMQCVWKISLECVSVCELPAVRACTWSREEHARGQGSPRGLNRTRARQPPRQHRTTWAFSPPLPPLLSISLSLSFASFLSSFGKKGVVIHNPLNDQQLNYPSRLPVFSPLDGDSKTINLFTAGDFSQGRAHR